VNCGSPRGESVSVVLAESGQPQKIKAHRNRKNEFTRV
jgi:hypothetical protein